MENENHSFRLPRPLYMLLQLTWGLPQNIIGLILYMKNSGALRFRYRNAAVSLWNSHGGSMACGMFIFLCPESAGSAYILRHEYGHTVQSLMLGPLWLFVIGLPSLIWNKKIYPRLPEEKRNYYRFYTERWANKISGL